MAKVIDALQLVRNKKRLPTEAFFVDTNIVLDYADPFGRSLDRDSFARRNSVARETVHWLKSNQHKALSTISVALEYYKVLQVGFYQIYVDEKNPVRVQSRFDPEHFKQLRGTNADFIERWRLKLGTFERAFKKWFPPFDAPLSLIDVVTSYDGGKTDFGDHLLFKAVIGSVPESRCIFSNDADFLGYPDDFYLLTTNTRIINATQQRSQ